MLVTGDVLCLKKQSGDAGLTPKAQLAHIGGAIIIAGLSLQVVIFAPLLVCCTTFQVRFRAHLK